MVREQVTPSDAAYILQIPIPMVEERYQLVWSYTKEGTATRSVYHRLKETIENRDEPGHDDKHRPRALWKEIWGRKRYQKLKVIRGSSQPTPLLLRATSYVGAFQMYPRIAQYVVKWRQENT